MRSLDGLRFGLRALGSVPLRTGLMLLAMSLGVGAVMVLSALGEGARGYVVREFSSLGTNLVVVLPGRSETTGGPPPLLGTTPRDLTTEDAMALYRARGVRRVAPISLGSAPVAYGRLSREVTVIGSTAELQPVRHMELTRGRFLPVRDASREGNEAVIGTTLARALFGNHNPLGRWIRIHDSRFRVIGVLEPMGQSIGLDIGDLAVIPLASAQRLFDSPGLFRVLIEADSRERIGKIREAAVSILRERHDGEDDVTVITQDALLTTFDGILRALTYGLAGIASISLLVAGILIMNVMLIAVSRRTAEIGLLKALGGPRRLIQRLFLIEAALLALAGAAAGVLLAQAGVWFLAQLFPTLPLAIPLWSLFGSVAVALLTGLVFGVLPARRAARLDPVQALTG